MCRASSATTGCRDIDKKCSSKKVFCTDSEHEEYMKLRCAKTCNFCDAPEP